MSKQTHKLISEQMSLRSYRVRAYLNPKSGRVVKITAGCRRWHSIAEATAHYAGYGDGGKWTSCNYYPNAYPEDFKYENSFGLPVVRREQDLPTCIRNDALLTIARIAARVLRYQNRRRK